MFTVTGSIDNMVNVYEEFKNGLDAAIMVNSLMAINTVDLIEVARDGSTVQEYKRQTVRDGDNITYNWFVRGASIAEWTLILSN